MDRVYLNYNSNPMDLATSTSHASATLSNRLPRQHKSGWGGAATGAGRASLESPFPSALAHPRPNRGHQQVLHATAMARAHQSFGGGAAKRENPQVLTKMLDSTTN